MYEWVPVDGYLNQEGAFGFLSLEEEELFSSNVNLSLSTSFWSHLILKY